MSTLSAYYDKNTASQFDVLFGDTYIGSHKTELSTEYGVAQLRGKSLAKRAEALIRIAHLDFRSELRTEAKQLGIL